MAKANFIKQGQSLNDELKLSVHSYLPNNNVDSTILDQPAADVDELVHRGITGNPGHRGKQQEQHQHHGVLQGQQPMEISSFTSDTSHPSLPGIKLDVLDPWEMTSTSQHPLPHQQRHSKWTNRKYLSGVSINLHEDSSFQPPNHNDIAVVTVDKHSTKLPLQQQRQQHQPPLPPPKVKNFPLPSAEAWSDSHSDRTANQQTIQTVTTAKSKVEQQQQHHHQQKSITNSSLKNKSKTPSSHIVSRTSTTTAQPPPPPPSVHIGFPSSPHFSGGTYRHHRYPLNPSSTPFLTEEMIRQKELDDFYKNYDPREGIVTAIVLGGFFIFVSLLVLYKTKCKPMWKNRRKRLTNTPVTQSVVEGDSVGRCHFDFPSGCDEVPAAVVVDEEDEVDVTCDDDFGFECIPLQTVCNDDEDNDDIYFLDEFGNYVFPVSTPTIPGSCSCPPSAEDLSAASRRVSQVSNMSAAYTVKSLPGGYIYIPVSEASVHHQNVSSSMPSVKRTLSDPEIHFTNPLGGHPIILTVNPSSEIAGTLKHANHRHNHRLNQRSFSVQQEGTTAPTTTTTVYSRGHSISEVTAAGSTTEDTTPTTAAIDINVIQATPNISPSCSLRSFSVETSTPSAEAILTAIANEPSLHQTSSPATTSKGKVQRRVSFSEEEVTGAAAERSPAHSSAEWPKPVTNSSTSARSKPQNLRQNTLPNTMSYLQVPGQQTITLMAPALTVEAFVAQTSVQARKRRSTRLMKAGSFCSITSEGDGDIFGPGGGQVFQTTDNETVEVSINEEGEEELVVKTNSRKTIDPLLSDYSEFYDNDKSDISDLFERRPPSRLRGQRTLSDEYGSIRSLSVDHDEQQPQQQQLQQHHHHHQCLSSKSSIMKSRSVEDDEDTYASSSCSISIESDCEPGRGHQITVPVTIEPPPPEMRTGANVRRDHHHHRHHHNQKSLSHEDIEVCQTLKQQQQQKQQPQPHPLQHSPKSMKYAQDSTEEIRRASPGIAMVSSQQVRHKPEMEVQKQPEVAAEPLVSTTAAAAAAPLEPGMRMVLVRDIGVQVSGDSPNLNLSRRAHNNKRTHQLSQQTQATIQKQDSLAEKFPAEILF